MNIETNIDFQPNIISYLMTVDKSCLYFNDHNLKHPLAIYNTSFSKIEDSLIDFFEIYNSINYDTLSEKKDSGKITKSLKNYKNLLYTLNEHLDDCFHITKTFIKPSVNLKKRKNQFSFLKDNLKEINSPALEKFLFEIAEYKKHINDIVNSLKHDNSIINSIIFFDEFLKEFYSGYFVANVINEKYQPVEKIHPKFGKNYTCFSFNRDIRWHIYNVFRISEKLIEFLTKYKIVINSNCSKSSKAINKKLLLYSNIRDLTKRFFPDEYLKPIPSIAITKNDTLKLECPSKLSLKKPLNQVVLTHSGDGVTREFVVPYM